ncbi:hypothetical protein [Thalassolituus pacificus]|uniref:Uncharacterized protein n=1 Tax=Thalassolituus pacificus TaxID=2975440 RepID=A0A9X2WDW0_9GAMM|nr:hypothetical protein [Thalassolituus pacificus]MCT7358361.1 hypothetical protein [Thalassolituus pacificus]
MRKIRTILTLMIIAFMFAPLSQCTKMIILTPTAGDDGINGLSRERVTETYVVYDKIMSQIPTDLIEVFLLITTFFAPLFLNLLNPVSYRMKLLNNIAQLAAGGWLLYFSVVVVFLFGDALLFGYLFCTVVASLNLVNLYALFSLIKNRTTQQLNADIPPT